MPEKKLPDKILWNKFVYGFFDTLVSCLSYLLYN